MSKLLPENLLSRGAVTDKYLVGQRIGKGAFSEVFEVADKTTGKRWAIKMIKKKHIKQKFLEREIQIMQVLQHESILHCEEVYETEDMIYLVLELVHGGELYDKIIQEGEYSEQEAKVIMLQLINAVEYLHKQGVAHRDLKPENILCVDRTPLQPGKPRIERIKIADFGLSKMFTTEDLISQCGSPTYVAPEVLSLEQPYNKAVDMWSMGVIAYILLTGCFPFYDEDKNYANLYQKILNVEYTFPERPQLSFEAKNFIQNLLVRDTTKRFTPDQCRNHPWMRGATLPWK